MYGTELHKPKVVIILVNYNGFDDTVECVKSLLEIDYENYEILIVENGSNDKKIIEKDDFLNRHCNIVILNENIGFSGGNNVGINEAEKIGAEFVLLLNNDTVVEKNFLSKLVKSATKENAAITTGNIAFYANPGKMWYSNGSYDFVLGKTNMINPSPNLIRGCEVSFSTGCLMLISMKYIKKYGILDESFFLYSEDTDYCCKALKNGEKIFWTPEALIYHKISASAKDNSKFQQYYLIRNNLFIVKKYGKNKMIAYLYRIYHSVKQIVKGKYDILPFLNSCQDFVMNKNGRSKKY